MSVLSMIQDASNQVGIPEPTVVVGSADQQVKQLLAIASQEGRLLAHRNPRGWNKLQKEATHSALAAQDQGAMTSISGSDFDFIINDTIWNRTTQDRLNGPLSPQLWQTNQAISVTSPYPDFRIRGGNLILNTSPTVNDSLAWEYVSKNWCQSSGGTAKAAWTVDTDTGLLDEDLMVLGVIWRWLHRNGLDYEEDFNTYEREVSSAISRDGGKIRHSLDPPNISMSPRAQFSDGSWLQ
jgi:hypothetical protein